LTRETFSPLERIIHHEGVNTAFAKVMGLTDEEIEKIGEYTPFDLVNYEKKVSKLLLPVMKPLVEGLEEWTLHCESIAESLIHAELRQWAEKGLRQQDASFEMRYTVESECPRNRRKEPNSQTIIIEREELENFRRPDYDMTKEKNPPCGYCSTSYKRKKHDPTTSFMLFEFPWHNEYTGYLKEIQRLNKKKSNTNIDNKLERAQINSKIAQKRHSLEQLNNEVYSYFIEHRVKGWFSLENKIARILTRFDERRNIQKQVSKNKSIGDGSALILATSSIEKAYSALKYIQGRVGKGGVSRIDAFKDYMGKRTYDDRGEIVVHGPKIVAGEKTYEALKMIVTYLDVPIEVMIMTRKFYDTYKTDRPNLTVRMRDEMVKLEKEQGIPIYGIQRIIGNLIHTTHARNVL